MKTHQYIILLSGISLTLACGTQKKAVVEDKSTQQTELKDPYQAQKVTAIFIDANKERILGNFKQAMNIFRQCLSIDPDHAPSMFEMARLYHMQGSMNDALHLADRAVEIDPENKWYKLMLASLYKQSDQINAAITIFEKLKLLYPEEVEFMYEIALLYLKENRFADAIAMYEKIERIKGSDKSIIIQKKKLYLMNNQPEKAIEEIEKLIRMYPGESRYYALLAELYMGLDDFDKSIETLRKISELDPQNPYIHITLAEYYFKVGERDRAFEELKNGFANPDLEIEIKFQVLFTYYIDDQGDYEEQIFELNEILISTHPNDTRPYSLKADMLIREEKYEEAREVFRKVLEIDKSQYFKWETLLRLNAILVDTQALHDESLKAIALFPLQPLPYLFAGLTYFQLDDYPEAIKMFNKGKDLVVDDDELLAEFYMHLGDTYSKTNQNAASDAAFDQSLLLDPDNPHVLNNYSYYLALRKERLKEAKKMSAKSLEIDPENMHYLDTYGWILYQMGKYEEAKIWIEKSIENNASENAVVLEHLGDVLYKLGEKQDAIRYWEKALELGGDTTEFLEKKVKEGTIYE